MLHENLWRLLLDWPPALGLRPEKDAFIAWRNARQGGDCLAVTQNLLRQSLRPIAEKCLEMLVDRSTEEEASGRWRSGDSGHHSARSGSMAGLLAGQFRANAGAPRADHDPLGFWRIGRNLGGHRCLGEWHTVSGASAGGDVGVSGKR